MPSLVAIIQHLTAYHRVPKNYKLATPTRSLVIISTVLRTSLFVGPLVVQHLAVLGRLSALLVTAISLYSTLGAIALSKTCAQPGAISSLTYADTSTSLY